MPRVNVLPPPITGDVYRLTIWSRSQGQVCMNVIDYMGGSFAAGPSLPMGALLLQLVTAIEPKYVACLPVATSVFQYTLACLSSGAPVTLVQTSSAIGTVVGNQLPLEMAAIQKKRSALRGQHGLGRFYMPAVPISFTTPATDPNLVNAAGQTAYNQLNDTLKLTQAVAGIFYDCCITKRPTPPANLVTLAQPISRIDSIALLGTVRRRREGRGI